VSSPSGGRSIGACPRSSGARACRRALRTSRGSRLLLLAIVAVAGSLLPAAAALACESVGSPSAETAQRHARAVRCELNEERARRGLAPVRHDDGLALAAKRYSTAMVRLRFFDHVSPGGSTLGTRLRRVGFRSAGRAGETIGWGSGSLATPGALVSAWMASPPHRAIILDGGFSEVGVGVAPGSPAGGGGATVTADFAG
jgi:uncharacterized protein YkwD